MESSSYDDGSLGFSVVCINGKLGCGLAAWAEEAMLEVVFGIIIS